MVSADFSGEQNAVEVFLGLGDGTFKLEHRYQLPGYPNYAIGLALANFNGDGKPDAAVSNWNAGTGQSGEYVEFIFSARVMAALSDQ